MIVNCNNDFTTEMYRKALKFAKSYWKFIPFSAYQDTGRNILWRHDIDISVHRAFNLATIEAEEGVRSTFFILLHSEFYNPFSSNILDKLHQIIDMGHYIGLHFDPSVYGDRLNSNETLCELLNYEKSILENYLQVPIEVFSWHNPTAGGWLSRNDDFYGGLINAYGANLKRKYRYVSDSNGIWRHDRLHDVVKMSDIENLHVLTHPEWWQETPMPPRSRIFRSVWGWAKASLYQNDKLLIDFSRENVSCHLDSIKFLEPIERQFFELCDFLWNEGQLEMLFVELLKIHDRQIISICKVALVYHWNIPLEEINKFLNENLSSYNKWYLFEKILDGSLQSILGMHQSDYEEWHKFLINIMHGYDLSKNVVLENHCILLCEAIKKLSNWGTAQPFKFTGIGTCDFTKLSPSSNFIDYKSEQCISMNNDLLNDNLYRWNCLKADIIKSKNDVIKI